MKKYHFNDDIPMEEAVALIRAVERYMNSSKGKEYITSTEETILAILGIEKTEEEEQ